MSKKEKVSEAKDFWGANARLWQYLRPYHKRIYISIAMAFIATILTVFGPQFICIITDSLRDTMINGTGMDAPVLTYAVTGAALCFGGSFVFYYLDNRILFSVSEKMGSDLRRDLERKVDTVPQLKIDASSTGDIMSRMTNDCMNLNNQVGQAIDTIACTFTLIVGSIIAMVLTSFELSMVVFLPTIVLLTMQAYMTKHTQKYFRAQTNDLGGMNSLLDETYSGLATVSAYGAGPATEARFEEINQHYFTSAVKARVMTGIMPELVTFTSNLEYVIVGIVGVLLAMDGVITMGVISAFIIYVGRFNTPVTQLADLTVDLQTIASSSERVFEFLDIEDREEPVYNDDFEFKEGRVQFDNVCFGYDPEKLIIRGLNLDIAPGTKVALVGYTGAGKTTIVNLLMGYYDTVRGHILIDGTPIDELSSAQVHDMFTVVPQDPWLFHGTIAENVRVDNPDITDEEIMEACEQVGLTEFISYLDKGIYTELNSIVGLSEGQRQQIALVRALLRDAPIVVLDEPTSAIDIVTAAWIDNAMHILAQGRTAFMIAHKLESIRDAGLILMMKDGRVVESGTHEELMALNGDYKTLYDRQSGRYGTGAYVGLPETFGEGR